MESLPATEPRQSHGLQPCITVWTITGITRQNKTDICYTQTFLLNWDNSKTTIAHTIIQFYEWGMTWRNVHNYSYFFNRFHISMWPSVLWLGHCSTLQLDCTAVVQVTSHFLYEAISWPLCGGEVTVNSQLAWISCWQRVHILISIVIQSVIKRERNNGQNGPCHSKQLPCESKHNSSPSREWRAGKNAIGSVGLQITWRHWC